MPYSSVSEIPSYVTGSDKKKRQWMEVFNNAYSRNKDKGQSDEDAESSAFAQANGVAGPNVKTLSDSLMKFADSLLK